MAFFARVCKTKACFFIIGKTSLLYFILINLSEANSNFWKKKSTFCYTAFILKKEKLQKCNEMLFLYFNLCLSVKLNSLSDNSLSDTTVTVECRTSIKVLFLYFNLCLSVKLDCLLCSFITIYFVLQLILAVAKLNRFMILLGGSQNIQLSNKLKATNSTNVFLWVTYIQQSDLLKF